MIRQGGFRTGGQNAIVGSADGIYSTPLLPGFEQRLSRLLDVTPSLEQACNVPDEERNES
jgi:hypothetical protein